MTKYEYKGYSIENDGTYGMKEIRPIGKGSVPLVLRGSFTKTTLAQKAIDKYLEENPDKVK